MVWHVHRSLGSHVKSAVHAVSKKIAKSKKPKKPKAPKQHVQHKPTAHKAAEGTRKHPGSRTKQSRGHFGSRKGSREHAGRRSGKRMKYYENL